MFKNTALNAPLLAKLATPTLKGTRLATMCVPSATGENYCPNTAKEVRRRKGEASVRRRGMYGIPVAHNLKTRRVILHVLRPRRCLPNAAPHARSARTPTAATTGSNGSHPLNLNRTTDRFRFVNLILPVNPLSEPRKIRLVFLRSAYYHGYAHPSHIRCGLTYLGPDNDMDISQMDPNVATTTCSLRPRTMLP